MKCNYALGADPELFLFSKGIPVSAIDKIPGSKEFPHQVDVLPPKFCVQVDNCSVEYNIPPTTDTHEFVKSNNLMLSYLKQYFKPQKLQVKAVASVLFDPKQLQDPRAWIFGCEPDYNAWTLKMNPPPKCDTLELRSAGGHIHVGCEKYSNFDKIGLVRCLDFYVGAYLASIEPENQRSELYGKPGAMRFKPYGLEWRTPSNFWLSSTPTMTRIANLVAAVVNEFEAGYINTSDISNNTITHSFKAKQLCSDQNTFLILHTTKNTV